MRISVDWLKEFVDIHEDLQSLGEILTMIGLEAEDGIDYRSLADIVVAEVREKTKHPNADKLSLCQVFDGENLLSVVCGAPNVETGQKVAFAPVGAVLPGGFKIGKVKIRGEVSLGMICSERELGLSDNQDGIMVLGHRAVPGNSFRNYLLNTRAVLELDITPNRPDCFSHLGVARDLAVKLKREFRPLVIQPRKYVNDKLKDILSVRIDDPAGCPRYIAAVVKNVHVGPAPKWMVERLETVGQRSINNIVDISNYVLQEMGHPTHIFDYDKIDTGELVIRKAKEGDKLIALDETQCTLTAEQLLITNGPEALALAGIMGGLNSAINDDTSTVLIESAYFNPSTIRRGAKKLGFATEASKRFERGADPEGTVVALWRVIELLEEFAGGEWVPGIIDLYPRKIEPTTIEIRRSELDILSGCLIADEFVEEVLTGIGCTVERKNSVVWICRPPTFRPDLEREVDLIEEIVRLHGYDQVPTAETYVSTMETGEPDPLIKLDQLLSGLKGMGFYQCFNNSLQPMAIAELHRINAVKIMNPLTEEMTRVRTSLLPGLVQTVDFNIKNGSPDLRLFEWGNVFSQEKPGFEGITETMMLAGVLHGDFISASVHDSENKPISYFTMKGAVQGLISQLNLGPLSIISPSALKPGYEVMNGLSANGETIGWLGILKAEYITSLKLKCGTIFAFELLVDTILAQMNKPVRYRPIIPYPVIERDLNFVLEEKIPAGEVVEKIVKNGHELLQSAEPVNIFRHASLGSGKKSITFHLIFQSPEKTLQDKDVNPIIDDIVRIVGKHFKAKLR
ncbi:MAG: phenylalanine--tRNA ligase subunit beta [Fidelibacterota bacterium]